MSSRIAFIAFDSFQSFGGSPSDGTGMVVVLLSQSLEITSVRLLAERIGTSPFVIQG